MTFESGIYYRKQCLHFEKDKISVVTIQAQTDYEQTHITLKDNQQNVVIGQFLNQQDRQTILSHFKKAQLYVHSDKWWKGN